MSWSPCLSARAAEGTNPNACSGWRKSFMHFLLNYSGKLCVQFKPRLCSTKCWRLFGGRSKRNRSFFSFFVWFFFHALLGLQVCVVLFFIFPAFFFVASLSLFFCFGPCCLRGICFPEGLRSRADSAFLVREQMQKSLEENTRFYSCFLSTDESAFTCSESMYPQWFQGSSTNLCQLKSWPCFFF